eukprot:Gb_13813 [translate_table: standard]
MDFTENLRGRRLHYLYIYGTTVALDIFIPRTLILHSAITQIRLLEVAEKIKQSSYIMATAAGRQLVGSKGNSVLKGNNGVRGARNGNVMASYLGSANTKEHYRTLRLSPGASEKDVKKSFRRLALQYHPDVCKGDNCNVQFHQINQAYKAVMSNLVEQQANQNVCSGDYGAESMMGIKNEDWVEWEEWMGWEGAGTLDYSSHINIYV